MLNGGQSRAEGRYLEEEEKAVDPNHINVSVDSSGSPLRLSKAAGGATGAALLQKAKNKMVEGLSISLKNQLISKKIETEKL